MKNLILLSVLMFGSVVLAQDIPAFSSVSPGIYRGGRPSMDGMMQLKNLGVVTDINLQGGDILWNSPTAVAFMKWWEPGETPENIAKEKAFALGALEMSFVSEPLNAIAEITPEEDAAIERVLAIMNDPTRQPVFVHCEHGHDRTGLVVALYRVKFEGWTVEAAHEEWVAHGHSGTGAYFTGNLDTYFYAKTKTLMANAGF